MRTSFLPARRLRQDLLWRRPPFGGGEFHATPAGQGRPLFGRSALLVVGMKDGKKQRKPKSTEAEAPPAPATTPKPPPRVDPRIGIPARAQIRWVKINREYERKAQQRAVVTRSFRKETKSEEEYREERKQREQEEVRLNLTKEETKNFALSQIHNTRDELSYPTVLVVDGYNAIGWMRQQRAKNAGREIEVPGLLEDGEELWEAREQLLERLCVYSLHFRVRVVVAWDAMQGGWKPNMDEVLPNGVTQVFCGEQEADTFMQEARHKFMDKGYKRVVLASNDELVRIGNEWQTYIHKRFGKQEVACCSVRRLLHDVHLAERALKNTLEENNRPGIGVGLQAAAGARGKRVTGLSDLASLRNTLVTQRNSAQQQQQQQQQQRKPR